MRWAGLLVGTILIVFGVLSFTNRFPGRSFTVTDTVTQQDEQLYGDTTGATATQKSTRKSTFPLAPVLGVIALGGGLYLVVKSIGARPRRKEPEAGEPGEEERKAG